MDGDSYFDNKCTEYGFTSSLTRRTFSKDGWYYVSVGASGEGKVWIIHDEMSVYFGKQVCELKGFHKLDVHPNIGSIPAFAPNVLTG